MSRAAASQAAKKDQKANLAAKNAEKEELAALGLTPALKKLIGVDKLLCTACGATQLGHGGDPQDPQSCLKKCICPGGVTRPAGPGTLDRDHSVIPELITAAKGRDYTEKTAAKLANAKVQASVAGERVKRKEAKDADAAEELDAEYDGVDGKEMAQTVQFAVGKLGFDLERNVVYKVSEGDNQATDLGVKVGWAIQKVGDTQIELTGSGGDVKKRVMQQVMKVFKASKPCPIKFRCPLDKVDEVALGKTAGDGCSYCFKCDKFVERKEYSQDQLAKPAGARMCWPCEETADMFGEEDEDY